MVNTHLWLVFYMGPVRKSPRSSSWRPTWERKSHMMWVWALCQHSRCSSSVRDEWPFFFIPCVVLNRDTQWHNGPMMDNKVKFRKLRRDILFGDWSNNRLRWTTVHCTCTKSYKYIRIVYQDIFWNDCHGYSQGHLIHIKTDMYQSVVLVLVLFSFLFQFQHNGGACDCICVAQSI